MKRILIILSVIYLIYAPLSVPAPALEKWNAGGEITRLLSEAPTLTAFPSTKGVVWLNSHRYSLMPDGGKFHNGIFLLLLGDEASDGGIKSKKFPYPKDDGAVFEIDEAALYDASTGERIRELAQKEYDENGIRGIEVLFPDAAGHIAAVTTTEIISSDYRLDDVIIMSGELPVWEQTVEVEVPDGMRIHWEASGVREPERRTNGRTQVITWTVLNEPAWVSSGLVESWRPALVFSLDTGLLSTLKNFRKLENPIYAPKIPSSVSSTRVNLVRTVGNIAQYMSSRLIYLEEGTGTVRPAEAIPEDGPWTAWEQVLITGKWLSSLGINVNIYWEQNLPVSPNGPMSPKIWKEPVLRAIDSEGREIYFKAGQSGDPEKLHPSLFGATLYRAGNNGVERITLPRGSASDHTMIQNWRVSVDENGVASGTLDITMTGGWMDVFAINRDDGAEKIGATILKGMLFNVLGTNISVQSVKPLPNGCRASFSVEAIPGIVSSGNILLKLMGGIPESLGDIPQNGMKFNMRFPFVFEIISSIKTPAGYKALAVPGKLQTGDPKAMLEQSLTHWPKKTLAEGHCRWTIRSCTIDEYMSGRIAEQLRMVINWPETTIPLRK
ncbi:MAG: hypothetical protein FWE55_01515 [Synergistaceae bacterium]|nr:hypothetical protein [Synergistaceae bacterium]